MPLDTDGKSLLKRLSHLLANTSNPPDAGQIVAAVEGGNSASIALALDELPAGQALRVFICLPPSLAAEVLARLAPDQAKEILKSLHASAIPALLHQLPPREAAAIIGEASTKEARRIIRSSEVTEPAREDAAQKLVYRAGTAGRLMTTQFVRLHDDMTVEEALRIVRSIDPHLGLPSNLYVVDRDRMPGQNRQKLLGAVSLHMLVASAPERQIQEVMARDPISVQADTKEREVASLLSGYRFMSLPVTDRSGGLLGVIPTDDLLPLLVARLRQLHAHAVGTDAERMERLTPAQEARLRVPWLLGTMAIELCAGLVVAHFNHVLEKVILLASFMPVISAISGNVGLQAAAITVRAVDAKAQKRMWPSLRKELATTLMLAAVCGLVLGTIGGISAGRIPFGFLIGVALTCSMITAGIMGTIIPMVSKRLGFDPATTAGPFETSFQDVVGFGVFLWLATMFEQWIV